MRVVPRASTAREGEDCLVDPEDVVGRNYRLAREGVAVIRPDGYLGLVATDAADPGSLQRYLADVLRLRCRSHRL